MTALCMQCILSCLSHFSAQCELPLALPVPFSYDYDPFMIIRASLKTSGLQRSARRLTKDLNNTQKM